MVNVGKYTIHGFYGYFEMAVLYLLMLQKSHPIHPVERDEHHPNGSISHTNLAGVISKPYIRSIRHFSQPFTKDDSYKVASLLVINVGYNPYKWSYNLTYNW